MLWFGELRKKTSEIYGAYNRRGEIEKLALCEENNLKGKQRKTEKD